MTPLARGLIAAVAVVVVGGAAGCIGAPRGIPGEQADAIVAAIETATRLPAFRELKVVSFVFRDDREWLWDRERGLVRLVDDKGTVLLDAWDRGGFVVDKDGNDVVGEQATKRLQDAWARFINDSFWLNPFATLRNEGAQRELVNWEGQRALVLRYESGGVTPGDTYLFFVDDKGLPTRWKLWVKVLPVPGFETTFEGWVDVDGALIATSHKGPGGADITVGPVKGGQTLQAAGVDVDPFERLLARR